VFVLLSLGVLFFTIGNYLIVPYSIGLCLTIFALQFHFPFQRAAVQVGQLTYGIYLIHPLIAFCINGVIGDQVPGVRIIGTFFVSAVVVFFMRLTFLRRVV
jgi:peptidoglycan/LPS O-acetylase OafA/YrhL